ncbi:SdiA-regulated domain-containing protein [Lacicoccus alkaliphilus]|uniref:Peptidylglycine monooxygenase n=2 Tax=Lacicoccus TaxID=3076172 RepID=A0A1M7EFN3_9BACL|nr:SdiA-regulated domain-containing protein [Salinicoccus alkaliphilus]SHL90533.1 peptidylglycine monooxygenase [Salinicoccus alkaliphilus DSM 16010]
MSDMVFRLGKKKYRVDSGWAEGVAQYIKNVSAVSYNEEYIYVLQRSDPFMLVLTTEGELVDRWHDEAVRDAHYLEVSPDGEVYVVERDRHRVLVFNKQGELLRTMGGETEPGDVGEPFNHPSDIAFSKEGDIFVADGYGNAHVHHFNDAGDLLNTWGGLGTEQGRFMTPHAILVDQTERVLVTDRENNRVQIFSRDGSYLKELNNVFHPMDICEDDEGFIYVTDQVPSLHVFNTAGGFIGRCRTLGTFGHGITVDAQGDIYIAEMLPDGLTKLTGL